MDFYNDQHHDWYNLYDRLSMERNPNVKELEQLFSQEPPEPIDGIDLRWLRLKLEATTIEPTLIEKTMTSYQLYASDNLLWTVGLSPLNIEGIMAKAFEIGQLSESEFNQAYQLAKADPYS